MVIGMPLQGMKKDTRMSQITTQLDDSGAVDPNLPPDPSRRTWVATACALGGVAGVATAVPFVSSFAPSYKEKAAGAPVEVDISGIAPGQMRTVEWRGKPVWILHRTKEQLDALPKLDSQLADNIAGNGVGLVLGTLFRFWAYRTFVFRGELEAEERDELDEPQGVWASGR